MSAGPLEHDWFPRPLPPGVELGEGCWLYSSYAFLHAASRRRSPLRAGADSGIYHGSFFELGPRAEVVLGRYVTLVGATIRTEGRVEIGDYSFVAHEVVIADHPWCVPPRRDRPDDVPPSAEPELSIALGECVWVGARAVLLKGARVGDGSIVGAGAVVDFEVPPRSVVAGNPGRVVGSVAPGRT